MSTVFTIGHSIHDAEAFIELVRRHGVTAVADVRSHPYSRFSPHFNREALRDALLEHGIRYVFLGKELGGRPDDTSCYVNGRVSYDLMAKTASFGVGLDRVRQGAMEFRVALMCSEKDPITCHRTILVCRHLHTSAIDVQHILEDGTLESMSEAEDRLLQLLGLPTRDLFRDRQALLEQAYQRQARRIAFQSTNDSLEGKADARI